MNGNMILVQAERARIFGRAMVAFAETGKAFCGNRRFKRLVLVARCDHWKRWYKVDCGGTNGSVSPGYCWICAVPINPHPSHVRRDNTEY